MFDAGCLIFDYKYLTLKTDVILISNINVLF
jgi:hypothetical protein